MAKKQDKGKANNKGNDQPVTLSPDDAADRYNQTLDIGSADYNAAEEGHDEVTEAYREMLRRRYAANTSDDKTPKR